MTKQYFFFSGCDYYPCGGMGDFKGSFGSLEEAMRQWEGSDWAHIAKVNKVGELVCIAYIGYDISKHQSDWIKDESDL